MLSVTKEMNFMYSNIWGLNEKGEKKTGMQENACYDMWLLLFFPNFILCNIVEHL